MPTIKIELNDAEIQLAIRDYVKKTTGVVAGSVLITHHDGQRDATYYSAVVLPRAAKEKVLDDGY